MRIEVPYLAADVDRHGNVRIYYRRKGRPKVRVDLVVVPRAGGKATPITLSADKRRRRYSRFVRVYVGVEKLD